MDVTLSRLFTSEPVLTEVYEKCKAYITGGYLDIDLRILHYT